MRYLILILLALSGAATFGQQKKDRVLTDTALSYEVTIPEWLNVRETGSKFAWGGTTPKVYGIENAILIKAFDKADHKNIEAFENYIVGNWTLNKAPQWSGQHLCVLKKELGALPGLGKAFQVSVIYQNKMYACKYVIAETKTAFLWIDFTSTPDLYPVNLGKFDEFLAGIKLL